MIGNSDGTEIMSIFLKTYIPFWKYHLQVVVTELNAECIRNMTEKKRKLKLFNIFEASCPIPRYKMLINSAIPIWMPIREYVSVLLRLSIRNVRLIRTTIWFKNDVV